MATSGLTDDLDVAARRQQIHQATTDNFVVVEQEHTDHVSFLPCPRGRNLGPKVPGPPRD
jgi:hypothetical protein